MVQFALICLYAVLFLLPFYLIQARGLDPALVGLVLTAQPVIMATARNVGMVLGVGLAGAVLTTVQSHRQALGSPRAMFEGIAAGFLVACGDALAGAVTLAVRSRFVAGVGLPSLEKNL